MFIGYLKSGYEEALEDLKKENTLFDVSLLNQTYAVFPEYCFAAYEKSKIVGVLSAYMFEKYLYINVLETLESCKEVLKRLVNLLLRNLSDQNVVVLVSKEASLELKDLGFKEYCDVVRLMHSGEAVAFNFSNSTAKQVSGEAYEEVSKSIDKKVYHQDREDYLRRDCMFPNSLKLSTMHGFLHSYVVNKRYIKISPWLMDNEAYIDAEKLLRGVLYYRGLKKIYGYAPKAEKEIVDLYQSYKFKIEGNFKLMYLNEDPNIKLENLYGI